MSETHMRHSVYFNHQIMGTDPSWIRDWAQAVEGAGFDRILAAEHVVGGHPDRATGLGPIHTNAVPYHEPFVLFGYLAAVTTRVELMTAVLVLPQRQTALVAKQATEVDLLSGGRLALGVGVGRNFMEYQALNEDFTTRGRRLEEQVEVLRRLWSDEYVSFDGRWHHLDRIGLNPRPIQRPIPIWMGSFRGAVVEAVVKRAATMSDGWLPQFPPDDEFRAVAERFWGYARDERRDLAAIGMECPIEVRAGSTPESWHRSAAAFESMGATHLRCVTSGYEQPADHLAAALAWLDAMRTR